MPSLPDLEFETYPVAHLPVLRALIDELGIHQIVNEHLPRHALSRVSDADCVVAMMLNILCGRVALFRMDEWLGRTDVELLLGRDRPADAFDDSRLATALDHIDAVGTDTLLSAVVQQFLRRPERDKSYSVHQDFTTISLYGEYEDVPVGGPRPLFGFSKDHRPDLRQLVFGLSLHGSAGIPLVCTMLDGNTSDVRANRDHLSRLSRLLPAEDEVTVVGDCKLVDGDTLGQLLSSGFHFVSLLPDSFVLRRDLVEAAVTERSDPRAWPLLGTHPGRRKTDPVVEYRGWSVEREFPVLLRRGPGEGEEPSERVPSQETLRFLVVHSDALAAAFDARLAERKEAEVAEIRKRVETANRKPSACEADARSLAAKLLPNLRFHRCSTSVRQEVRTLKRSRRGRPRADELPPTQAVWLVDVVIEVDQDAVASERQHASCFPLITDHLDVDAWPDARILAEYRHQQVVEGVTGFRWLKGPAAVAPMFLKTTTRVRALGLIMVLALMVRNLWQYRMRSEAKAAAEAIMHPFTRRPVTNLTAEMAMEHFGRMQSVLVRSREPDAVWQRRASAFSDTARQILRLLRVREDVFWRPPLEKIERSSP